DGKLVVEDWSDHAMRTTTGKVKLEAGRKYDIKLEYYENTAEAGVMLGWSSDSQPWELVPKSRLFADASVPVEPGKGNGNGNGNGNGGNGVVRNISQGKKAYASSVQSDSRDWLAGLTDGDASTRWASKLGSDQEWVA